MVNELDLFESNHGCGLNALFRKLPGNRVITQHYTGPELAVTSC
jgi:hypothetical protein